MMKKVKNLISSWSAFKTISKNPGLFKLVEDVFKFIETTHNAKAPMVCKIALINMGNGESVGDFVSLWAGIGESSPIERVRHLKNQNTELSRLLTIAKEGNLSNDDKQLIDLTLKAFSL